MKLKCCKCPVLSSAGAMLCCWCAKRQQMLISFNQWGLVCHLHVSIIYLPNTKLCLSDSSEAIWSAHLPQIEALAQNQQAGFRNTQVFSRKAKTIIYLCGQRGLCSYLIKCWMICFVIVRPFRLMVYWLPTHLRKMAVREKRKLSVYQQSVSGLSVWFEELNAHKFSSRVTVCSCYTVV